jgi:hypothetical protein
MRKLKNYQIEKEDISNMVKAGRFNPALELTYKNNTVTISAGYSDSISVYEEDKVIYILTYNDRLRYIGLEIVEENTIVGDIFLQSPEEVIGPNWENKADYNLIKILRNYIY